MKNKLVSVEKYDKLIRQVNLIVNSVGGVTPYGNKPLREILAMPDFVESEEDVEAIKDALWKANEDDGANYREHVYLPLAQAAINALQYRKDGE